MLFAPASNFVSQHFVPRGNVSTGFPKSRVLESKQVLIIQDASMGIYLEEKEGDEGPNLFDLRYTVRELPCPRSAV